MLFREFKTVTSWNISPGTEIQHVKSKINVIYTMKSFKNFNHISQSLLYEEYVVMVITLQSSQKYKSLEGIYN